MCVQSEKPHIPLTEGEKKVYTSYHYIANHNPCGEILASRLLARSQQTLKNVQEWANQTLFTRSSILENHPWCLAWDYTGTQYQNICQLRLEKKEELSITTVAGTRIKVQRVRVREFNNSAELKGHFSRQSHAALFKHLKWYFPYNQNYECCFSSIFLHITSER